MLADRQVEYLPLAELQPDPRNPKAHALEIIVDSMRRFGFVEPIVVDERTSRIVSGHGRHQALTAMQDRGDEPPAGIRVAKDGRWLVPVAIGWESGSDLEAAGALIALNRAGEVGGWVDESLLDLLEQLGDLSGVGFDTSAIDNLRIQIDDELNDDPNESDADDEGDAPRGALLDIADLSIGEPGTKVHTGDHWLLGHHHLFVVNPHTHWEEFVPALVSGTVLAPYPDVWLTLTETARAHPFVLVQPNLYLAGHTIDKHSTAFPDEQIVKVARVEIPR